MSCGRRDIRDEEALRFLLVDAFGALWVHIMVDRADLDNAQVNDVLSGDWEGALIAFRLEAVLGGRHADVAEELVVIVPMSWCLGCRVHRCWGQLSLKYCVGTFELVLIASCEEWHSYFVEVKFYFDKKWFNLGLLYALKHMNSLMSILIKHCFAGRQWRFWLIHFVTRDIHRN